MELKIDVNASGDLNNSFGITDTRMNELLDKLDKMQARLDGTFAHKAAVFKEIISYCDTLEECVLLTHTYTNYVNFDMAVNKKMATVDLAQWCSPTYLAGKLGCHISTVTNWAARGRIDTIYIEQLSARLVRNINNINELRPMAKKVKKK